MLSTRGEKMREERNLRGRGEDYSYSYFADRIGGARGMT
jgi:hypothetical protein